MDLTIDDFVYSQFIRQVFMINTNEDDSAMRFDRLLEPIAQVANKQLLVKFLINECHAKVSSYDYEALQFINQEIIMIDPGYTQAKKNLLVLDILMNYTRTNEPSEEETKNNVDPDYDVGLMNIEKSWQTTWSMNYPLRFKRLPFHAVIENPFTILSMELTDATLPRLLPLGKVLDVSSDKFYEAIVHQKVNVLVFNFD